ncbi:MAG: CRISPR-associated protein Csx3 [Anaerolineae bacterium]
MTEIFPAVLIGGPPHSGKSVLVYSLTQALRRSHIPHYVLRACPDGEGNWANEADQALVRTIRMKGAFNETFMDRVAHYLQKRHLPLLVDVGGKPTPAQEAVFAHCTHAILLIGSRADDPVAFARELAAWRQMMVRQGVSVIAEMKSCLAGENELAVAEPILQGTLAGLERGKTAVGPAFAALVDQLKTLFSFTETELTRLHLAQVPVELTLDLPALARTLGAVDGVWQPAHVPQLWDYLPVGKPLAVYGRAPNWLYATLAMVAHPAPFWLFDARLGWVKPPTLPPDSTERQTGWQVTTQTRPAFTQLEMQTRSQYLDIEEADALPLVNVPADKGVVLSGKIPHWLITAVTRQLAPHLPWTAVYQPQLQSAVVVYSRDPTSHLGERIAFA